MRSAVLFSLFISFILLTDTPSFGQQATLDYYIDHALKNDPSIKQNINQQQFYGLQSQLINAQNKKPQINFTSDYLFVPYFGSDGHLISITPSPSADAFGYDAGLTNGGTYATQMIATVNLFNKKTVAALQEQNNSQAAVNSNAKGQLEHDLRKAITDQYIQVFQTQQQEEYLGKIIEEINGRRPTVEALVKRGLLQQSDYLLLEIELNTRQNDLNTAQIAEVNAYNTLKNLAVVTDTGIARLAEPVLSLNTAPANYYYKEKFKLDSLSLVSQQKAFNTKYIPTLTFTGSGGMLASDFNNLPHTEGLDA